METRSVGVQAFPRGAWEREENRKKPFFAPLRLGVRFLEFSEQMQTQEVECLLCRTGYEDFRMAGE
jgi:hypothetical protein